MSLWVVQRWVAGAEWADVLGVVDPPHSALLWDAENAGQAFHDAVLDNPHERLSSASYRVLLYEGGASFTVGINVDATAHPPSEEEDDGDRAAAA